MKENDQLKNINRTDWNINQRTNNLQHKTTARQLYEYNIIDI